MSEIVTETVTRDMGVTRRLLRSRHYACWEGALVLGSWAW